MLSLGTTFDESPLEQDSRVDFGLSFDYASRVYLSLTLDGRSPMNVWVERGSLLRDCLDRYCLREAMDDNLKLRMMLRFDGCGDEAAWGHHAGREIGCCNFKESATLEVGKKDRYLDSLFLRIIHHARGPLKVFVRTTDTCQRVFDACCAKWQLPPEEIARTQFAVDSSRIPSDLSRVIGTYRFRDGDNIRVLMPADSGQMGRVVRPRLDGIEAGTVRVTLFF